MVENLKITIQDIKRNIGSVFYSRGLDYYSTGKILAYSVDVVNEELTNITSSVKGSGGAYSQKIKIYKDTKYSLIIIKGSCSCPVGDNCKHVATVCIKYNKEVVLPPEVRIISQKNHKEEFAFKRWLNDLNASQESKELKLENGDYFLTYRLDGTKSYSKGKISFYKSKRLKNGSMSKGIALDTFKFLRDYAYPELKSQEDKDILQLMKVFVEYDYHATMQKLSGSVGAIVVKKIVQSGRCYFDTHQEPIRFIDEKFQTNFQFKPYKDTYTLKSNFDAQEYRVIETTPLFLLDIKNNTLQEMNIEHNEYKQLSIAPKIPKERLNEVFESVDKHFPKVAIKTPKSIVTTKIKTMPRAKLHLQQENSFSVDFLYDEYSIKYLPQLDFTSFYENGVRVEIQRDLVFEEKCKRSIEDFGFEVKLRDDTLTVHLEKSNYQEQLKIWSSFLESGLEQLRSEGWEIIRDDAFTLQFESNAEVVVESEASNNWFDLSFNLEFNGVSQAIAPLVSTIISEFNNLKEMPEIINVEVQENHFVSIETKQIKPILRTIIELFDKKQSDDSLRVSAYDAHLVDFIDDDVIWRGSKDILQLSKKLKDFKGIQKVTPPECLNAQLREYQQDGLNWLGFLHEFKFGGILADDMGLGKTIQTLAHLSGLKESNKLTKPSLIVMPTSLIANWKNEAQKFTPNLKVLTLYGNDRAEYFSQIDAFDVVLTTYSLVTRDEEVFSNHSFYYIILDEAQKIKNPKTKMAIALKNIKSEYRLALSGTPIENHLGELWSIFSFLMPGFLDTLSFFRKYYQLPVEKDHNFERQNLLNRRIKPFMIRRTKEKVADELPAKSEIVKYTQFDAKQSRLYESIRVTMEKKVREAVKEKGLGSSHITILDALLKLRQVCCDPSLLKLKEAQKVKESAKLELFLDLIDELMQEGRKVLVFSQFTSMLAILEKSIQFKSIPYSKLTGSTRKREEAIEKFTKGDADIFLISLKAGGVGLNLVEADTVIHYDPWWNPAVENQATDRAYRIGQTKAVFVYKLIVENTIEQKILELQKKKQAIQESVYDENKQQEDIKFSGNELLELLQ